MSGGPQHPGRLTMPTGVPRRTHASRPRLADAATEPLHERRISGAATAHGADGRAEADARVTAVGMRLADAATEPRHERRISGA